MKKQFKIEDKIVHLKIGELGIDKKFILPLLTDGETHDLQIVDNVMYQEVEKRVIETLVSVMEEVGFSSFSYSFFNHTSFDVKRGKLEIGIKDISEFKGVPLYKRGLNLELTELVIES